MVLKKLTCSCLYIVFSKSLKHVDKKRGWRCTREYTYPNDGEDRGMCLSEVLLRFCWLQWQLSFTGWCTDECCEHVFQASTESTLYITHLHWRISVYMFMYLLPYHSQKCCLVHISLHQLYIPIICVCV